DLPAEVAAEPVDVAGRGAELQRQVGGGGEHRAANGRLVRPGGELLDRVEETLQPVADAAVAGAERGLDLPVRVEPGGQRPVVGVAAEDGRADRWGGVARQGGDIDADAVDPVGSARHQVDDLPVVAGRVRVGDV